MNTGITFPITITRSHQPYTVETWEINEATLVVAEVGCSTYIKALADAGYYEVKGRIVSGSTTSRLFTATSTKEYGEKPLHDYLPPRNLVDGSRYITVAM
jgi:uncharacterized protein YuzB (UPF0349 family)